MLVRCYGTERVLELKKFKWYLVAHLYVFSATQLTDIKKKHSSHAITNDVSIDETARAAEYFLR